MLWQYFYVLRHYVPLLLHIEISVRTVYEYGHDVDGEELAELLLLQHGPHELLLTHLAVMVLVHLRESVNSDELLAGLRRVAVFQKPVQILHHALHLLQADAAVAVHVKDAEQLFKNLLWRSLQETIVNNHKLDKVDDTISISVVDSKHMRF